MRRTFSRRREPRQTNTCAENPEADEAARHAC
jgi:hypothetical protein